MSNQKPAAPDHRLPMIEIIGRLYHSKRTGRLSVTTSAQPDRPIYTFWFKRGCPCFSHSAQGIGRLGEELAIPTRPRLMAWLRSQPADATGLLGQRLISASLITLDELQLALHRQLEKRLLGSAALPNLHYRFEEGMEVFASVPLSSLVLNPLDVASRMAQVIPLEEVKEYAQKKIKSPRILLAPDRRLPESLRPNLSTPLLESLEHPTALELDRLPPSRLRTLIFLAAFRFIKGSQKPPTACEPADDSTKQEGRDQSVTNLMTAMKDEATWYELLGVRFTATRNDIKRRYRELAFEIHPDRLAHRNTEGAQEVFGLIVEAYQVLSRDRTRVAYDLELARGDRWKRLGTLPRFLDALKGREQTMRMLGQDELAIDYQRMQSLAKAPNTPRRTILSDDPWMWAQD